MGEVTPCVILTKCGMWEDIGDAITCATFGNRRLRGVGVAKGVTLPSPIINHRRPCSCRRRSTCSEQSSSRSAPIPGICSTSVSETIQKPPLVEAQTAFKKIKYGEKRFSIWRMEFFHPAMWHVALESRQ